MSAILTNIEAFELKLPLPRPLRLGSIIISEREYVIVRLYDNEGNQGTAHGLSRNAPVSATIHRTIAPIWEEQLLEDHQTFYQRAVSTNSMLGTNGVFWRALSLADCALFDLLARRAGLPMGEYLGGHPKPVPANLVGCYPTDDENPGSLADEVAELASFMPYAIKIASCSNYTHDTERLRICRSAIPQGPPLILDLYNHAEDVPSLLAEARNWEAFNLAWIEDPFAFDDYHSLALLGSELSCPVAAGDEQSGYRHFQRLIREGHVGILRLDATVCGGVRAFLAMAEMAAQHGIPVAGHVFHHLHSQLACAVPNLKWVESFLPHHGYESIHLVWHSDLEWNHGNFLLADRPGIGIEWDENAIKHYRRVA